jgi:hypothetical protein
MKRATVSKYCNEICDNREYCQTRTRWVFMDPINCVRSAEFKAWSENNERQGVDTSEEAGVE